jgi:hypothetical protein
MPRQALNMLVRHSHYSVGRNPEVANIGGHDNWRTKARVVTRVKLATERASLDHSTGLSFKHS